jgi:hypothetical protein
MHSTEPPQDAALEIIGRFVTATADHEPVRFVLELARSWKERGGFVAGKPRHSDRYLDDLLRGQGTPVKSLTPKLAGRTNLQPADGEKLVRLFLSHWDYLGDQPGGADGSTGRYRPMVVTDEIERVSRLVSERIAEVGPEGRGTAAAGLVSVVPGQGITDNIVTEFRKSRAIFTVGPGQTVLVTKPEKALLGFRELMNRLWAVDRADDQERLLIWILDLGRQDFDDDEARRRFLNVEAVISRFKALRLFKEADAEARWNWLQSRSVIVLHDTLRAKPAVAALPAFDPNHVLFSAVPPRWLLLPEFRTLYGSEFERLDQSVYEVFLRRSAEGSSNAVKLPNDAPAPQREHHELHYFGYALFRSDKTDEREVRGLELAAPGRSYVEALGTVFAAAAQKLGLRGPPTKLSVDGMEIDSTHACESLRHHGFHLLRLEEFAKL